MNLPAVRLSQYAMETARTHAAEIASRLVRVQSPALHAACKRAGLSHELAELCAGLLASVVDDLIAIGKLPRSDFERTKRKQRILAAAQEPAASALRLAIAASPINGRAAVAHWDAICDKVEIGKLAWLLGLETETSHKYGRKVQKRS